MHSRFSDRWVTAVLVFVAWVVVAIPVALAEYQPARSAPSSRGGVTDRVIVGFRTEAIVDTAAMHAEISALSGRVALPLRAVGWFPSRVCPYYNPGTDTAKRKLK